MPIKLPGLARNVLLVCWKFGGYHFKCWSYTLSYLFISFKAIVLDQFLECWEFCTRLSCCLFFFFYRQLCLLLNAEDIYRAMSEILLQESDFQFASLMVRYLNMILLTSSELFDLRDQLRELATAVSRVITFFFHFGLSQWLGDN